MADAQPPRRSPPTTTTAVPPINASAMSGRHYDRAAHDRADRDWPYAPPLHAAHPHPPPPPPPTRDPRGCSAHDYQPHHHHPHHANYAPAPVDPYAAPAHVPPPRHDLPYARPPPPGAAYPYAQSAPGMTGPPPPHYPYNTYPYAASAPYHGQAPLPPPPRTQQQQEPQPPPVSAHAHAHAQHASTSANATVHARGGSDTTSPATAAAGPAFATAAAAGSAADAWARESPADARRRPVDAATAAAAPPRAPHPDELYSRHHHPYYSAADPAYSGYPPPYGWHGPPPPWAAYHDTAAHHAWRYPPGARLPPPPMGRVSGWPSAGEPPYAAELPYAAQYPTDASYPAPSAPYVKSDPDAPYPARGPPSSPPGPSRPPAYAWTAPAAAHEAVHDPSRYTPRDPAPLPPPLPPAASSSHAASTPIGTAPAEVARGHNANDRVANGMSPTMPRSRTGSAREGAVKAAAASSSAPTPSTTRPPSRAVSGGAAEENEGERPRREYVVLTRDLYRAMEASLQDPANPVFPPGMLRKRWRRLMSSFEYHGKNPAWRTLTWKGCLLYIAPQEDWDAIVLDEYHAPPTDPVARHGLDTPAPHRSVTQTFKQLQRRYQTRRSRAGIPLERVEEIVARCPCNQHPATAATVAADVAAITITTDSPTSAPAPPPRAGGNVSTTTSSAADRDDTQLSPHRPAVPPTQLPAPQPSPRDRADHDHVEPAVPMSPLRHTHHEAPYRTHPSWPVQRGPAGNGTHDPRAYPPSGYSGYPDAPSQSARRYSGQPAHEYSAAEAAAGRAHAHGAGWDE
ncbi:hypothetical protein GGF31_008023 [Allomyces arbusculus]|nr:hypothetical protein GGF31_008023 [Allomyces arbusculus]